MSDKGQYAFAFKKKQQDDEDAVLKSIICRALGTYTNSLVEKQADWVIQALKQHYKLIPHGKDITA